MIHIVVVGGGPSGIAFAQTAASKLCNKKNTVKKNANSATGPPTVEITVLEKREHFFHVIGALRGLVDESFIKNLFIPYDNALKGYPGARIITGASVSSIDYNTKTLSYKQVDSKDLKSLQYDYLVLATGSSNIDPIKPSSSSDNSVSSSLIVDQQSSGGGAADVSSRESIEQLMHQANRKIQGANRILVVGGGAVGIELAGELKSFYPEKRIMLLSRSPELLSNQNVPKMRRHVKKALEDLDVELILGERIKSDMVPFTNQGQKLNFGTVKLETEKGLVIESDAQIYCTGMTPNVDLMTDPRCLEQVAQTSSSSSKTAIKVRDTFQVLQGENDFDRVKNQQHSDNPHDYYDCVFAIGDVSNHSTPKMAYWGMEQGKHLGKSLADNILNGIELKPYKGPSTEALMVPLGPNGGVSQLPLFGGLIVGNFLTSLIKSKTLFVGMFRKQLRADSN